MKKFFATILVVGLIFLSAQAQARELTAEDEAFAKEAITNELTEWGCTPLKIWFSGTPIEDAENVKYMNDLASGKNLEPKFTACMLFYSNFMSPPDPHDGKPTAWTYDKEYKDYSWYFGLYEGKWILMTNGY